MAALYEYTDAASGSGSFFSDVAGEALGKHKLVYLAADSLWYLADADDANKNPVLGLTLESIAANVRGRILVTGYVANPVWAWVVGGDAGVIYASVTPGELTQTPPVGFIKMVAVAKTSTSILFNAGLSGGNTLSYDPVHTASYIVWVDGATYYVKNGVTGEVENTADIASLIQTKINEAGTHHIYFKYGTYALANYIVYKSYLTIDCDPGTVFTYTGTFNSDTPFTAPLTSLVSYFTLKNCRVNTYKGGGILLQNTTFCTIENVDFYCLGGTSNYGILLEAAAGEACYFNTIINCDSSNYLRGIGLIGVAGNEVNVNKIIGGRIQADNIGLYLEHAQGNLFENLDIEGTMTGVNTTEISLISGFATLNMFNNCHLESDATYSVTFTATSLGNTFIATSITAIVWQPNASDKFINCYGFVTENSGTGSIDNATTSDIITHGLSYTPTAADITITLTENPTNSPGAIWVDTIGAATFTVNCENDPGASNLDFGWSVRRI